MSMILPQAFCNSLPDFISDKVAFLDSLQTDSPVSIRCNPRKKNVDEATDRVSWCFDGQYLSERPIFTLNPLLHAGAFYVQEASSMFLAHALRSLTDLPENPFVLDLCAAPGGKTTLISSFLQNRGVLLANEIMNSRVGALSENLQKWGNTNTIIINSDADAIGQMTDTFDLIVCDAPCSGEGMFRKDSDAIDQWNRALVEMCSVRQKAIVDAIWDALNPGGYFIYSTCTYNLDENEQIIAHLIEQHGAESIRLAINNTWGIVETNYNAAYMYRFLPHLVRGEGFALAVLQKANDEHVNRGKRPTRVNKQWAAVTKQLSVEMQSWFNGELQFLQNQTGLIRALSPDSYTLLQRLPQNIRVVHAGIDVAEQKGKDFIPQHGVAMCPDLRMKQFVRFDASLQQALQFLHKDAIVLDPDLPKSWILICYDGVPLGFVKNLGNRTNNNYPSEWRIRMNI